MHDLKFRFVDPREQVDAFLPHLNRGERALRDVPCRRFSMELRVGDRRVSDLKRPPGGVFLRGTSRHLPAPGGRGLFDLWPGLSANAAGPIHGVRPFRGARELVRHRLLSRRD